MTITIHRPIPPLFVLYLRYVNADGFISLRDAIHSTFNQILILSRVHHLSALSSHFVRFEILFLLETEKKNQIELL